MQRSETIGSLAAALAKAQGEMATAAKDSKNPHFNSKYADLASIWNACREPLAKNDIAVIQAPGETAEKVVTVTTLLSHKSGEWIEETLTIPMSKVDAQGYGSAVTYARRYALAAMVGIAPAEDDGNAAAAIGGDNNSPRRAQQAQDNAKPALEEPEQGWGGWALDLQGRIALVADEAALNALRDDTTNKHRINALRTTLPAAYASIGKAFAEKRAAIANPVLQEAA